MTGGLTLGRLGLVAAQQEAVTRRKHWLELEGNLHRRTHKEQCVAAADAWRQTGLAAENAVDYLDATTDRFAAQAVVQVDTHTQNCLGLVEKLARQVSLHPNDEYLAAAYQGAEDAVSLAEDVQEFIHARVPVHERKPR